MQPSSMNWIDGKQHLKYKKALYTDVFIRFREVPPFGVDGIRRIRSNQSELKKMTAHDYEDMLQVGVFIIFDFLDLTNVIHAVCYTCF